jgi:hypothetical protein
MNASAVAKAIRILYGSNIFFTGILTNRLTMHSNNGRVVM